MNGRNFAQLALLVPGLALFVLAGMVLQRDMLRRQVQGYVGLTSGVMSTTRAGRYWLEVGGTPPAAKELRLFGLAGWTIER